MALPFFSFFRSRVQVLLECCHKRLGFSVVHSGFLDSILSKGVQRLIAGRLLLILLLAHLEVNLHSISRLDEYQRIIILWLLGIVNLLCLIPLQDVVELHVDLSLVLHVYQRQRSFGFIITLDDLHLRVNG